MKILGAILGGLGFIYLNLMVLAVGATPIAADFETTNFVPGFLFLGVGVYFFVCGFQRRFNMSDLLILLTVFVCLPG